MITQRQANRLRGLLRDLLERCDENATAGALRPEDARYVREEYAISKRRMLDEIKKLTEEKKP